jgi:hypothetical protein
MTTSINSSFFAQRGQTQRAYESRNISPSPARFDESYYISAFLADRGVKLPPATVVPMQMPKRKSA